MPSRPRVVFQQYEEIRDHMIDVIFSKNPPEGIRDLKVKSYFQLARQIITELPNRNQNLLRIAHDTGNLSKRLSSPEVATIYQIIEDNLVNKLVSECYRVALAEFPKPEIQPDKMSVDMFYGPEFIPCIARMTHGEDSDYIVSFNELYPGLVVYGDIDETVNYTVAVQRDMKMEPISSGYIAFQSATPWEDFKAKSLLSDSSLREDDIVNMFKLAGVVELVPVWAADAISIPNSRPSDVTKALAEQMTLLNREEIHRSVNSIRDIDEIDFQSEAKFKM